MDDDMRGHSVCITLLSLLNSAIHNGQGGGYYMYCTTCVDGWRIQRSTCPAKYPENHASCAATPNLRTTCTCRSIHSPHLQNMAGLDWVAPENRADTGKEREAKSPVRELLVDGHFRGPAARHEKRDLLLRCFVGSTGRNQRPGDLQQAAKDPDRPRALVLVDSVTDDGAMLEVGRLAAAPRAEDEDLIMRPRRRVRPRVRPCGGPRFRSGPRPRQR
jgi:hypothetical protein